MVAKIRKIAECSKYFHEIIRLLLMISVFLAFPIPMAQPRYGMNSIELTPYP